MRMLGYLYALVVLGLVVLGVAWAVGSEQSPIVGDVGQSGGARYTTVAPSTYKALADCVVCHRLDKVGAERSAPSLNGIVGAPVARSSWFAYSPALARKGGSWSVEELDKYLTNPVVHVPGTFKTLTPIRDADKRREIIDALKHMSDSRYLNQST